MGGARPFSVGASDAPQLTSSLWAGELSAADWETQHGQEFLRAGDDNGLDAAGADGIAPTLYATIPAGELLGVDRRFWLPNMGLSIQEEVYLRYRVWIPDVMDWGGGGKMPGLAGKPVAGGVFDLSWGGARIEDSWSCRVLFGARGDAGLYVYASAPIDSNYPYGYALHQTAFDPGWNTVVLHVAMNTPGAADGSARLWVNEWACTELSDVEWRGADDVASSIILCNWGYGGDVTDAPATVQTLHFADFELFD